MTRYSITASTNSIGLVEGYTVVGTLHNERNEVIKTVTITGKIKSVVLVEVTKRLTV